jgi:hypothetical protein
VRYCLAAALLALALAACGGGGEGSESSAADSAATATLPATTGESTETTTVETTPATTETSPESDPVAADLAALAEAWYAEADPAVCERMTKALLEFGWKKSGQAGVAECKRNLEDANPVQDVAIDEVTVEGNAATVTVSYTLDGDERTDRVHFVLRKDEWLMNEVAVVVEEAA